MTGQGTLTWPNSQMYVGEFKDDERTGQGTYTWFNGNKYVGEFKDGKKTGQGTFTWSNGQMYVGEFKDGREVGGWCYFTNGKILWTFTDFQGNCIYTFSSDLPSSDRELPVYQVQSMLNISIRKKEDWGFYGHSTIEHSYENKSISGGNVVIDHATDLMWHKSGSKAMMYKKAKKWLRKLNKKDYAGYHDWRLPTVEEAASLLESSKRNDLYIDPVFSNKQNWIWTSDECISISKSAWSVNFDDGYVGWISINGYGSVRPVRSGK